ncbi:MAG: EAL domain-containing protein [Marinagarivorans sp.]|nr:EAL domain-containing protein [Marinagarivorans sp.]
MPKPPKLHPPKSLLPVLRGTQIQTCSGEDLTDLLAGLLIDLPVFITVISPNGIIKYLNKRIELFQGVHLEVDEINNPQTTLLSENELSANSAEDLFKYIFPAEYLEKIHALTAIDEYDPNAGVDLNIRHKDHSLHSYRLVKLNRMLQGNLWTLLVGTDVTAHKHAEHSLRDHKSRLDYMVYHDPLTGLANRSLFYDRVSKVLKRAQHEGEHFALLLVDLDRFKNVNDSLGHDAGDAMLKHVADILAEALSENDTLSRLGGDEFVIIIERIRSVSDVEIIANRILKQLSTPILLHSHQISCTASIGICFYPRDGDSIDQLLKHADAAMYRAKAAGKNRFELFLKDMNISLMGSLIMENELRQSIERGQMQLHYQPQIDLSTGKIIGLEALVRWQHPVRGMISPMEFIPLAEETGLIEPLGEWVLRHACERFRFWLMAGINLGRVAVNISAKQFRLRRFEQTVMSVLTETRLAPQYLELEITESSAMENAEEAILMLNCLSKLGLSLAIDDFGTGYSSLTYLQRFPINKLKIDRSFVNDIDDAGENCAIAKSIIDLAHNLKLEVLAEGVERSEQSAWLLSKGCNQVQGFYFSKPLSEEHLMALINSDRVLKDLTGVKLVL